MTIGRVKSFILRSGRMSLAQERSYKTADQFLISYSENITDFSLYFCNDKPLTVEIGFGMGKATAEIATVNPDKNYLGIEVFRAGIGKLLWEIKEHALANIRIIEHDAVDVVEKMLAPGSVAAFHLFFPDPWPKKRHHKRRLVQKPFAELLASRLKETGYVYMVSDWDNYAEEALKAFSDVPCMHNPYGGSFADGISWRPETKFEKKGLEKNNQIKEIFLVKRGG